MNHPCQCLLGEGPYPPLEGFNILLSRQMGVLFPGNPVCLPEGTHAHSSYEFLIPLVHMPGQRVENRTVNLEQKKIYPFNTEQDHGAWHPFDNANFLALQIDREFLQEVGRQVCGQPAIHFKNEGYALHRHTLDLINRFVHEARNRQLGYEYVMESLSAQIVIDLIRKVKNNANLPEIHQSNMFRENIRKAVAFITESYNRDFSLNDVARVANLSPYHFVRVFKSETGKTPFEYLANIRIHKACELLKGKEKSMTEICYLCGFCNPSHFSSVFKKIMSISPSGYRERYRE